MPKYLALYRERGKGSSACTMSILIPRMIALQIKILKSMATLLFIIRWETCVMDGSRSWNLKISGKLISRLLSYYFTWHLLETQDLWDELARKARIGDAQRGGRQFPYYYGNKYSIIYLIHNTSSGPYRNKVKVRLVPRNGSPGDFSDFSLRRGVLRILAQAYLEWLNSRDTWCRY